MTYVHIVLYDFEAPRTIKKLPFKLWMHTVKVISNRFSVSLMNPFTIIVTFYRSLKEHVRSPLTHSPLAAHSFNTVSPTIYAPKHFCLMIEQRVHSPPAPASPPPPPMIPYFQRMCKIVFSTRRCQSLNKGLSGSITAFSPHIFFFCFSLVSL